jgi:hypothetical protein
LIKAVGGVSVNNLLLECDNLLKNGGFDYAFCGGHALDIHLGITTRPHGDIDLSAYWDDRNSVIKFMKSQGWIVYETMGGGKIHLITDIDDQKLIKLNIFCVKEGCLFFHTEHFENDVYHCEIDHVEQKHLDYIEFLFNKREADNFIYSRNNEIRRALEKAILYKDSISYFSPELVLLYKSTDLSREENRQDFDVIYPHLLDESREWLCNALKIAFSNGHEWIMRLEDKQ